MYCQEKFVFLLLNLRSRFDYIYIYIYILKLFPNDVIGEGRIIFYSGLVDTLPLVTLIRE